MSEVRGCIDGYFLRIGPKWLSLLAARSLLWGARGALHGETFLLALSVWRFQASLTFVRLI